MRVSVLLESPKSDWPARDKTLLKPFLSVSSVPSVVNLIAWTRLSQSSLAILEYSVPFRFPFRGYCSGRRNHFLLCVSFLSVILCVRVLFKVAAVTPTRFHLI